MVIRALIECAAIFEEFLAGVPAMSAGQEITLALKSVLAAVAVGLLGGWAVRSLADSPQGAGVKLLGIAMNAKERVGRWAAVGGEHLEDMVAEARSQAEPDISRPNGATNESRHKGRSRKKRATPRRRGARLEKREEPA
jgi:hypothetical protein